MTVGGIIESIAKRNPNKLAIITEDEKITYKQLYENMTTIQQNLISILGAADNKKIGLILGNSSSFVELFLAITTLGGTAIPFDPKWSTSECNVVLDECKPDLIVHNSSANHLFASFKNAVSIKKLKQRREKRPINWSKEDQAIFYIGYTSGSTGKPKGFMRTHQSWLSSFLAAEESFQLTKGDLFYVSGPLCHSLSLFAAVHAIHMGASLYLEQAFNAEKLISVLEKGADSVLYLVPTMLYSFVSRIESEGKQISGRIKFILSGAKCSPELKERTKRVFSESSLFEFYGASELSFVSFLDDKGNEERPKSVGKPFPGLELFILKENQTEASIGEIGTLYVKSPFVFSGYVNDPDAARVVIRGDLATVGDLAYKDAEGYITIVGREKNMIISGGLNIYPEEVELVIKRIPEIEEAVVQSVKDDYWGEKLIAFVKWHKGKSLSFQELKNYCRRELASYKCPREFIVVNEFPYTSSGKIARQEVLKLLENESAKR